MDPDPTMQAVFTASPGGPDVLEIGSARRPACGPNELLVRVRATALNRADLLQRSGKYPPPEGSSSILGLEMAGEVVAVGEACEGWEEGARVCGLLSGGGYAQYTVIHHGLAMRPPQSFSYEEAAAIPEVFLTAYQALHWYGRVDAGKTVLIHAGASGVGTAGIQLARAVGARVFVTASKGKHDVCLDLGAEEAVDYRTEDFAERIHELTGGRGVDVIVDFIGGPYFERNAASLALDGRLILLAMLGGSRVEHVDLRTLFARRASVFASTLRSRDQSYKIRLARDVVRDIVPKFEDGSLRPVIDRVLPWTRVAEAHRVMEENQNIGKIVLQVD
ncbi:MAG: NAD(P)H-quinone oxidoreductase [Rhodothermales bacterium]